jgi:hypothetical protein
MNTDADLIQRLGRSNLYNEFKQAFCVSTGLPLTLRPCRHRRRSSPANRNPHIGLRGLDASLRQPRVFVNPYRDVMGANQLNNLRIPVRDLVHDMAPVTPHCAEIQQDKAPFFLRLRVHRVRPSVAN